MKIGKAAFAVALLVCVGLICTSCAKENYMIETEKTADVTVSGGDFGCDADELIALLNGYVDESGLMPIRQDCVSVEEMSTGIDSDGRQETYNYAIYNYDISEAVKLSLYSMDGSDNRISALQIVCKGDTEISEKDRADAEEYFKIACGSICPAFDCDKFLQDAPEKNSAEIDGILFYSGAFNTRDEDEDEGQEHRVRVYYISVGPEDILL